MLQQISAKSTHFKELNFIKNRHCFKKLTINIKSGRIKSWMNINTIVVHVWKDIS